jgi:Domain of unknown function (DUF4760)
VTLVELQPYLGSMAILASMCIATLMASISIRESRSIARQKNATDILFNSRQDSCLREGYNKFRNMHSTNTSDVSALAYSDRVWSEEATQICYVLNHYEYLAVGIHQGIYDEPTLKRAQYGIVVKLYSMAMPFIMEARSQTQSDTLFADFEQLCIRWRENPLTPPDIKHRKWWKLWE